jgi:hypothetical protein
MARPPINRQPRLSAFQFRRMRPFFIFFCACEIVRGGSKRASTGAIDFHKMGHIEIRPCASARRSSERGLLQEGKTPLPCGFRMSRQQGSYTVFRTASPSPFITFQTKIGTFLPWPKVRRRSVMRRGLVPLARRPRAFVPNIRPNKPQCLSGRSSTGRWRLADQEIRSGPRSSPSTFRSWLNSNKGTKCDIESRATLRSPVSECAGSIPHRLVCSPPVSPILKALTFQGDPGVRKLVDAIEHFKEKDGGVPLHALRG